MKTITLDYLRSLTRVDGAACHVWIRGKNASGYGQVRFRGRQTGVHRVAYELAKGAIPRGFQVDHLCRNRACCNPDHLEAVSSRTNTLRGASPAAVHARKTHCVNGHPFDAENCHGRSAGGRDCRACKRDRMAAARRRLAPHAGDRGRPDLNSETEAA